MGEFEFISQSLKGLIFNSTHRQRKHQYFKSLESEVLRLRASEVSLLARVQTLSDHVNQLQRTLGRHGLSEVAALSGKLKTTNGGGLDLAINKESIQDSEQLKNGVNSRELPAGIDFDLGDPSSHLISQDHLDHVMSDHSSKVHAELIEPTNIQKLDLLSGPQVVTSQSNYIQSGCTGLLINQDMADMGMEFVMA